MSDYVRALDSLCVSHPDAVAYRASDGSSLTYGELKSFSDSIATHLSMIDDGRAPVMVYGHKSRYMIPAFLGCVKSGHAYVPGDTIYPDLRIADMLDQLGHPIVLNASSRDLSASDDLTGKMAACYDCSSIVSQHLGESLDEMRLVRGDDVFYILFTSGSTGRPKGVEVTAECVDNFYIWMKSRFATNGAPRVVFNRAPFTFDVSLGDMLISLGVGGTMFSLSQEHEADLAQAFTAMRGSGATLWSSTPTFVEMCLRDRAFSPELLPELKTFVLAGEALRGDTVIKLLDRFEGAEVVNAYGPTESTDLVSTISISREMAEGGGPLPIGYAKDGTELVVLNPETLERCEPGEAGELFIVGNTVAKGYFERPDLTAKAFGTAPASIARGRRSYRTGDEVYSVEDGCIYYRGRLDTQIKLHGYRMELGEIESTLCGLWDISSACVLPVTRNESISHLVAFAASPSVTGKVSAGEASEFDFSQKARRELLQVLPEYMVPRKVVFLANLPIGASGKVDRAALKELL